MMAIARFLPRELDGIVGRSGILELDSHAERIDLYRRIIDEVAITRYCGHLGGEEAAMWDGHHPQQAV